MEKIKEISKEKEQDHTKILEKPGSPTSNPKVINVISEGYDICGTSYLVAKRHAKVSKKERGERPQKNTLITNDKEIGKTFRILTMMDW